MKRPFIDVPSDNVYTKMEEDVLAFWQENDIFHRSVAARSEGERYVFYEGPPTANGLPGAHHVLARVFKDVVCRYKSMRGYLVERKAGWDCHGLPVELEVEKRLGMTSKPEIEAYGIDKFNNECRDSVLRYTKEWEELTRRIGFWVDIDKAYVTFTDDYIESLWWCLRQLWDKDLLYQGHKVVPYCARCGTSLSSHEVAQGYSTVTDPSIFVRFKAADADGLSYLVWTTTPWTLVGNVALAVHPDVDYVRIKMEDGDDLILAEALVGKALGMGVSATGDDSATDGPAEHGYEVIERYKGAQLVGRGYLPILPYCDGGETSYRVVPADFVTVDDGSGIVHIAPAYGEDDMKVGVREGLPVLHPVDLQGRYTAEVTPWVGRFVKDADPDIIEALRVEGKLYKALEYEHTYPFCWRCDTPLLYYAKASWFIRTTAMKERLIELNKTINWVPEHIKEGRFGQWLDGVVDWALSRERYWGTPLPIWVCECGAKECMGSKAELTERASALPEHFELHRPWVDEVVITCSECGAEMRRVTEVIDAWFDSGAMPVAQWHYPFENQERFKDGFPADYISEGIDQTRGWFFSLHVLGTLIFDSVAYKNVISLGHILDENGEKMSKHKGNVVRPWEVLDKQGADALRWYFFTMSPPGSPKRFAEEGVTEVLRKFLLTLWNTYSFFVTYANIDGFEPTGSSSGNGAATIAAKDRPDIDRWLISARERLVSEVTADLDAYDITGAGRRIAPFVDDLSNWYVRRCRRRYWKSEEDTDKLSAYQTLWETLVTLSQLLAPFAPFISETIYRNLVARTCTDAVPSVHMTTFPVADTALIDDELEEEMSAVRQLVSLGRAARTRSKIKIRQPLSRVYVSVPTGAGRRAITRLADQILEELNVKEVQEMNSVEAFMGLSVKPNLALLGKRLGAMMPKVKAALEASDAFAVRDAVSVEGRLYDLLVDGETIHLSAEDLLFEEISRDEFVVESGGAFCVALSLELTPELRSEGTAREIVHFVQSVRKDAGFDIEDRILLSIDEADAGLSAVLTAHETYIYGETLADKSTGADMDGGHSSEKDFDGRNLRVTVIRRP